jgi:hypothetical protein
MIDGEENFRLKYQKMNETKSSIYIANYDLDPNLQLIRGDTISRSLQIHGLIASGARGSGQLRVVDHGQLRDDETTEEKEIAKKQEELEESYTHQI